MWTAPGWKSFLHVAVASAGQSATKGVRAARASPPMEDDAGDNQHCRHRQHLRERFRGRPLGGFLHAVLPRLGRDSSLREGASESQSFTRNTPRRLFALIESPLSEYRPCQGQIVMRRHFDLRARPLQHRHQCPQATGTSARPAFTADGSRFFKSKESAFDTGGKSSLETILRRPIPLSHGRYLVTLEDAGNYITKLPKAEHTTAEWQALRER